MTLDSYTRETLNSMVSYMKDDRLIAQYLRIPEVHVRRARTRLPMKRRPGGDA